MKLEYPNFTNQNVSMRRRQRMNKKTNQITLTIENWMSDDYDD